MSNTIKELNKENTTLLRRINNLEKTLEAQGSLSARQGQQIESLTRALEQTYDVLDRQSKQDSKRDKAQSSQVNKLRAERDESQVETQHLARQVNTLTADITALESRLGNDVMQISGITSSQSYRSEQASPFSKIFTPSEKGEANTFKALREEAANVATNEGIGFEISPST